MADIRVNCPSCGAPLSFRPGTMVAVCNYCRALSARTDRDPKLIGKVADLVNTGSPLVLGMEGRFGEHAFKIVGRTQMRHPLGGVWDEWYLSFAGDHWGWLAEAQGRYYLTFRQNLTLAPPPVEVLQPGGTLNFGALGTWVVGETSQATVASAEGEIPWDVDLESAYPFADLSAPNGGFATLDYSEQPPLFFSGRETTLAELKLHGGSSRPSGPRVKAQSLPCPHCASPLKLQAPDQAQRVGCPSCGSLLDASEGRLTYLKSLKQPAPNMVIPLGTEGTLRDRKVICAGFMVRSCTLDDETFHWAEYLLLDTTAHAFLWLVESEGHWSLAEHVPPAEVRKLNDRLVEFKGEHLKGFQHYTATVVGVYGEFYWKVEQGERAEVWEFTKAPQLLAMEHQKHKGGGAEVNWSLSTYLQPDEVWTAFTLQSPRIPQVGIAPHQPNPHIQKTKEVFKWMWLALGLWFLVMMIQCATHRNSLLYSGTFDLAEAAARAQMAKLAPVEGQTSPEAGEVVFFSPPIELKDGSKNLEVIVKAPVSNAWLEVDGALASQTSNTVEFFQAPVSYYHGSDGGESWSEGGQKENVYLSALPKGTYLLRLAPQWEGSTPPVQTFTVELRMGAMHSCYYWITLLFILIPPLVQLIRKSAFEGRRWANSMYTSTGG